MRRLGRASGAGGALFRQAVANAAGDCVVGECHAEGGFQTIECSGQVARRHHQMIIDVGFRRELRPTRKQGSPKEPAGLFRRRRPGERFRRFGEHQDAFGEFHVGMGAARPLRTRGPSEGGALHDDEEES